MEFQFKQISSKAAPSRKINSPSTIKRQLLSSYLQPPARATVNTTTSKLLQCSNIERWSSFGDLLVALGSFHPFVALLGFEAKSGDRAGFESAHSDRIPGFLAVPVAVVVDSLQRIIDFGD